MKFRIGLRTAKTVISAVFALLAAQQLDLRFAAAAAIIAVLSVGNTKKATFRSGLGLMLSLVPATFLAFVSFSLVGYNAWGFGLYLLLFIPTAVSLKVPQGISVSSVLVTHYLGEQSFAASLVLNEFLLMGIGVGLAFLVNSYMPNQEQALKEDQLTIETQFKKIIRELAASLNKPQDLTKLCHELGVFIRQSELRANRQVENRLFETETYLADYFGMRRAQWRVLKDMIALTDRLKGEVIQSHALRGLLEETASTFAEANDGQQLLARSEEVYNLFRSMPLPADREEFETRADLYQFLQLFRTFIEIKAEFSADRI